ncbi:MAG: CPBP family intramembrane glutamic endopeptidase [Actinomycetota bacterium]
MFPAASSPSRRWVTAGAAVGALAVSNVATNRWLPPSAYVPWNLAVAGGMIALARSAGHSGEAMGFDRSRLGEAVKQGGMGAAAVGAAYGALMRGDATRRLLADRRLSALSTRATLWHLLVQIPLGTAVAEEVAFRGVLPLLLHSSRHPRWVAPSMASLLFGLWHLLPARAGAAANHNPPAPAMALTAGATTIAGMLLHRLRMGAGHLAAPVALHVATNAIGLLAVRMAASRR